MASAGFSSGAVFHPQESLTGNICRPPPKELQYFSQGQGKQNNSASGISNLKVPEHVDPWKCKEWLEDCDQLSRPGSSYGMPEIIDLQDGRPDSAFLSSGISDQCPPHGKIFQPLQFASTIPEVETLNRPIIPHLKGFKDIETELTRNNDYLQPSLVYPEAEVFIPKPFFEYLDDFPCGTTMRILPDSRMLFMGSEAEINDMVSMLSDIYRSRKSMSLSRRQMVIPYFRRSRNGGRSKMQAQTVTPRPETLKAKPAKSKKELKRAAKERDMYENTFFRACESLLCIIFDGNNREMNFLSLKKSGPEVSHLLMQLSAGITGAAVALLLSVLWRVAVFRVPFCATKMLNTGIGLGLVWLSAAVNSLRENIIMFSRSSGRIGWGDGEMRRVERSLSEISFRALTLMAIAVVRYV